MEKNPDVIFAEKNAIRLNIKKLKTELSNSEKQQLAIKLFQKIELTPEFQKASTIFIYWSLPDEIPTQDFIYKWSEKKSILLPVIIGDIMFPVKFDANESMQKGMLGIMEPESKEVFSGTIDLIIIPGIAFDKQKNRLGRGKGFYDKYLETGVRVTKIGVCFDFQLLTSLPVDKHDIKMDKIFTPTTIIN